MANLEQACEHCRDEIEAVFTAEPRPSEIISGDFYWDKCCFVRDEIRFLDPGRLIFTPGKEREGYCDEYFVICRKLVIVGGGKPATFDPCGSEDPGNIYKNKNAITWKDRLETVAGSIPSPIDAADGANFGGWVDDGQGSNGKKGNNGADGNSGSPGVAGRDAPDFTLIALEVELIGLDAHLIIDFDGQVGGTGGRGQNGGRGGKGMNGREGKSDTSWPGTGCDRQPGHGGDGGDGGDGGAGGQGGAGGDSGNITVITTKENVNGAVFVSGDFTFVHDGGNEGEGGLGGFGGLGGGGGAAGFKTSECSSASPGNAGEAGFPPPGIGPGSTANQGPHGATGSSGSLSIIPIDPANPKCAERIVLPIEVSSVTPSDLCRGFSTPANNIAVAALGQNLAQVTSASISLSGVTANIKITSTATQLDLDVDMLGNSALGAADLTLARPIGPPKVVPNAFEAHRFEVLSVSPNTAARGSTGTMTITGQC
ncbi:MAG TPA: hypothetical protein VK845_10920, partial [Gemmatimonadales bacterium]|nr:hypothetical protein [Gemmatimonadales bacterium]